MCVDVTENPPPSNETYQKKIHDITTNLLWKNRRETKQDGKLYTSPMSAHRESSLKKKNSAFKDYAYLQTFSVE